ncbi:MAG: membrane protein insertase YidC [Candidatus Omnitrophica bacterium]|nr:membrane protein insertase YidC [Candidatus Omnitrophota bacterium]
MDKDKNFITAIILTLMVIFFYPMLMKKVFPDKFPEPTQQNSALTTFNTDKPQVVQSNIASALTYSKTKSYVLETKKYNIVVNSPGGDIKSIDFSQIADPATNLPTILMDTMDKSPGIFSTPELIRNAELQNVEVKSNALEFTYHNNDNLIITKQIIIDPDLYKINLNINITNKAVKDQVVPYQLVTATGIADAAGISARFRDIIILFSDQKNFKKNPSTIKEKKLIDGDVRMSGLLTRYFALIVAPLTGVDYFYTYNHESGNVQGLGSNNILVPAGQTIRHKYVLYAGTNSHEDMAALNLNIEEVRGKGFFTGFSDLLLLLMRWMFLVFKNYGLAVIALALTINIVLYPLTYKSLKSMKEMQTLQPVVEKLRDEYKDKPEKLNKEIMEVYKKHKVNPAGGCLPMVLQMPVFFSLYGVLMRAIELRGANFLWIKDLASPDAAFTFSQKLPFLGTGLNILPLIMVVLSFAQQKMTNPGQGGNEQQKAMALMMPIFLGFIFYNFPSGLVLYFLTNSIFSFVVQMKLSQKFDALANA